MELKGYKEEKPRFFLRIVWYMVNRTVFRCLCHWRLYYFKNALLRLFGADVPTHANIYSSCKIFAPWNLKVGLYTTIGPNTTIYNKAPVVIGSNVVVSQNVHLCTAGHDISDRKMALISAPIVIEDGAWVAADAFVGMGVVIGKGAVVGARAAVFKNVEAWTVVGGNPARVLKNRVVK